MADRDNARPEFNPRHRIVGAIVIVALAVIFLPMILDEREPPSELKNVREIPAHREATETKVVVAPVVVEETKGKDGGATAPTTETPAAATESAPKPEGRPATVAEKPVHAKKPEAPPAKEKVAKVAVAEKLTKGWVVQVGTFSNSENAVRLRDKLKSHGHAVHAETVTLDGKKAMRLRVGPFQDKAQAVQAQAQIQKETGVQGAVQAYP